MKLSEFREIGLKYTEKASEINRQLSLGGIAIIWFFKKDSSPIFTTGLVIALTTLTISLLLDLLQYTYGGYIWLKFFRQKEIHFLKNPHSELDPPVKAPGRLRKPIFWFYYLKICLMAIAFAFIVHHLVSTITNPDKPTVKQCSSKNS